MGMDKAEVFSKWEAYRDESQRKECEIEYWEAIGRQKRKVVVLDDDPTGIQTVHGVFVYTDTKMESIREGLLGEESVFYILTNSRALGREETMQLHREAGRKVAAAAKELGVEFLLVSRGDSTLRGHYPTEPESLREGLAEEGVCVDGEIICPFFEEGGRFTVGDVHYVEMKGGCLVPAGETEFAKDTTFGYSSSNLKDWVHEKSVGKVKQEDVVSISLEELRGYQIGEITDKLMKVEHFGKVIVNALSYEDLRIFVIALCRALQRGKYFLFRTAASFVKVLGGIKDRALLDGADLYGNTDSTLGGLIVAGSHVQKTTKQLEILKNREELCFLEFSVEHIEDEEETEAEKRRILEKAGEQMAAGVSVVIYTGRQLRTAKSGKKEDNLALSVRISQAVTDLVARMPVTPRFMVAKGGITSSDIGTKALGVKKAFVPGQILAGVPVWVTGKESRFPGIPYVIFPGNVGADDALLKVIEKL